MTNKKQYAKPEVTLQAAAVEVIQACIRKPGSQPDNMLSVTSSAYESDE